jgi:hypothetical protein
LFESNTYPEIVRRVWDGNKWAFPETVLIALASLGIGLILLILTQGTTRSLGVLILVWLELAWFARLSYPTIDPKFHDEPRCVAELKRLCGDDPPRVFVHWSDLHPHRIAVKSPGWRKSLEPYWRMGECLYFERGPMFDVGLVGNSGQLPLQTQRLAAFRHHMAANDRFMRLMGISLQMYRITPHQPVEYQGLGCALVRVSEPVAFAYFCPEQKWVSSASILDECIHETTWPGNLVLLEGEQLSRSVKSGCYTPAKSRWQGPNTLVVDVDAPAQGIVVINEMNYPGWTARVHGKPVSIEPANYLFMAVKVPMGPNHIELRFESRTVLLGQWLGGMAWLVWLMTAWVRFGRSPSMTDDAPTGRATFTALSLFVILFLVSIGIRWPNWQAGTVSLHDVITNALERVPNPSK